MIAGAAKSRGRPCRWNHCRYRGKEVRARPLEPVKAEHRQHARTVLAARHADERLGEGQDDVAGCRLVGQAIGGKPCQADRSITANPAVKPGSRRFNKSNTYPSTLPLFASPAPTARMTLRCPVRKEETAEEG